MYYIKYCTMHDKLVDDRFALYNIVDNMNLKDQDEWEKQNEYWEDAKFDGQLDKAFMAEISEEMCQAEVAHHANHIPEFFVSRRVKNVHLYRKLPAPTCRKKPCKDWTRSSDIELYESRENYWFRPDGTQPSPYLPWKKTPEEQVQAANLYDFFTWSSTTEVGSRTCLGGTQPGKSQAGCPLSVFSPP